MSNEQRIEELKRKVIKINSISPSFCSAKWLQTTLYLQNGYNHSCHHPSPHKIPLEEIRLDPAAIHNSNYKKSQRKKMIEGVRPRECEYCWKIEDLSADYFSDRHYKTADYWAWDRIDEVAISDPMRNINPGYLEVSFSNVCNLKCSYCSPEISSKWLEEINQHGQYPTEHGNHNLEWLKNTGRYPYKHSDDNPYVDAFWKYLPEIIGDLKVLRVTGGEPLLSKDVWRLFEYLTDNPQPNLELAVNTNLCVDDKLIDKFIETINALKGSVKYINVYTSLESTGEQAEYSRFGLNYFQWHQNIRRLLRDTSVSVNIMTTINVLSLPSTNEFINDVYQLRREFNITASNNRIPLSVNYLRWPPHLSVNILPLQVRKQYADSILNNAENLLKYNNSGLEARLYLEEWDQLKRFCDYLTSEEQKDTSDFVKFITEYDIRRGTNFNKTFPEYKEFWKEINAKEAK